MKKEKRQVFKPILEERLKHLMGSEYIQEIAMRSKFSYEYVRKWLKSDQVHIQIEVTARDLLAEKKAEALAKIEEINS